MKSVSIVIPTKNEQYNLPSLIERINDSLKDSSTRYEIIIVDDHSTDNTYEIVKKLARKYPVFFHFKVGEAGKARSLIEGFRYARYPLICMIDGDLSYPPEAIPKMINKIEQGFDVVVGNRKKYDVSFKRKLLSKTFQFVFGRLLHGFDCDIQSGLKVFKKEITERLPLSPQPWTFDLEFLIKARQANYQIGSVNIGFVDRKNGHSKINVFGDTFQIAFSAIRLRFKSPEVIPFHAQLQREKGKGFHFKGTEYVHHSDLAYNETAFFRLSPAQIAVLFGLVLGVAGNLFLDWHQTVIALVALISFLYFLDLLFNFYVIFLDLKNESEIKISPEQISERKQNWPMYTILCPLYKEWSVVPQFVKAMQSLDYPQKKLQVLLLLEEDDKTTIEKIKKFDLPENFETLVVPHSKPKTKPKACNYGLLFAKGEYVVIYDAEDAPEADQLKKAVVSFENSSPKLVCVQAKLNFYNPNHNLLTRIFTAEYSLWFDLVLAGLQAINSPIPLGGTSNHFRKADLVKLKGWDSFNVTEDCDLGIRLAKYGYKTALIDSLTLEEANSHLMNWFAQRSRWIKGYLQTYLVHMRNPGTFFSNNLGIHAFTFQLTVGGKVFLMLINPLMWLITAAYFLQRTTLGPFIETFFPGPVLYIGVISLVAGNFLYLYYYMLGCAKRKQYSLIKYTYLVPIYWLFMSIAAFLAVYKLITDPHYWSKTKHGLHLNHTKALKETNASMAKHFSQDKKVPVINFSSSV